MLGKEPPTMIEDTVPKAHIALIIVPDSTRQSPSLVILAIWEGSQKSFASVKLDTKMDTISPKIWTQLVQE